MTKSTFNRASIGIAKALSAALALCAACRSGLFAEGAGASAPPAGPGPGGFQVLCWHDVPERADGDAYAVSLDSFAGQLEFLRADGCAFVSVDAILDASRGGRPLPGKAVLLTFDDALETFYANVFPLLKAKGYPCVLCVVSSWPDDPAVISDRVPRLMSWAEIKEVAGSGLVEIASHSHDGHKAVTTDPWGSTGPALAVRAYDAAIGVYESADHYRSRVIDDLESSARVIAERAGIPPRVLAWPYGRYTESGIAFAREAGFSMCLTLNSGRAVISDLDEVPRQMISGDQSVERFASDFSLGFPVKKAIRAIQADLDLVYDADPRVRAANVSSFVDRIVRLRPSVAYLQAFSDADGDGVVESVYFPNRVMPMKADFFGRVCRALSLNGIQVYAWMPMLSLRLPDDAENERLRVMERRGGAVRAPAAWYANRLSPFSEEAVRKLEDLYEDLASVAMVDGVLFQDDGYLSDFEDFSAHGLERYARIAGDASAPYEGLPDELKLRWTELKTDALDELADRLEAKVRLWRPTAAFARCLYARTVLDAKSEEWYAQSYRKSLDRYDYVVVMAYPDMERVEDARAWLREIVEKAASYPGGLERTVFKTQAYDWSGRRWVDPAVLGSRLRVLAAAGAIHLGYYPDDYTTGEPAFAGSFESILSRDPRVPESPR